MSTYTEIKDIPKKFRLYSEKLVNLFKTYDVKGIMGLIGTYKTNKKFQTEWKEIWTDIAKADGGKLTLTTIGTILGGTLGGVGIAAMGGAIGISLVSILGLTGFLLGTKFDDTKLFDDTKNISIELPNDLIVRLENDAEQTGYSVSELLEILIKQVYSI